MTTPITDNRKLLDWVSEMAAMAKPDKIVWIDGSTQQADALREEAVGTGELIRLNQDKLPGCYYHRTARNDVARTEHLTYMCTPTREDAGPSEKGITYIVRPFIEPAKISRARR